MRILFILFLFLFSSSCQNAAKVPKDILPVDKMHRVLWDMLRADELANQRTTTDTLSRPIFDRKELYRQVFQVHQVTSDNFKKSLQFYQNRPELLQIILDSLQKRASSATLMPVIPAP